jgi:hypothetical protein
LLLLPLLLLLVVQVPLEGQRRGRARLLAPSGYKLRAGTWPGLTAWTIGPSSHKKSSLDFSLFLRSMKLECRLLLS